MISEKMIPLMKNNSAIRMMFEEGNKLAAKYGRENVFDFSLGNPSVPAPAEVNQAIQDIVKEEDSLFVHGYMSNAGYEDVRETIAQSLNRRFGTSFHAGNILMTVGAASGLNVILKTLLNPGEQVITFAPYFVEYGSYVRNYDGELVVLFIPRKHCRRLQQFWKRNRRNLAHRSCFCLMSRTVSWLTTARLYRM